MQSKAQADIDEIFNGCLEQNRRAQQLLFEKFFSKFYSIAYGYFLDEDETKDCVQEAFIKIFDSIATYKHTGSFEAWMRRILVNKAIDILRKKKMNTSSLDHIQLANEEEKESDDSLNIFETFIDNVGMEAVMKELNALSPIYRTVLNLYLVEGLKHKEIAEILGITEGTSKSNLFKAKFRLKQNLLKLQHNKTNVEGQI